MPTTSCPSVLMRQDDRSCHYSLSGVSVSTISVYLAHGSRPTFPLSQVWLHSLLYGIPRHGLPAFCPSSSSEMEAQPLILCFLPQESLPLNLSYLLTRVYPTLLTYPVLLVLKHCCRHFYHLQHA
eukprot:6186184-Pleurochrysis_carterae.AAC.4